MTAPAAAKQRPLTLDHLQKRKKAPEASLPLVLDTQVADDFQSAKDAVDVAQDVLDRTADVDTKGKTAARKALRDAEAALDRAEAAAREVTQVFRFRAIGRKAYDDLVNEYPPTADQIAKAEAEGVNPSDVDRDLFPPALIAACLLDSEMSVDDWVSIWTSDSWTSSDLDALYGTAFMVNKQSRILDLGKGSGGTRS